MLRDSVVVAAVVFVRAMLLAMNQLMGFLFFPIYEYGTPLGGPSGRRSSARKEGLHINIECQVEVR